MYIQRQWFGAAAASISLGLCLTGLCFLAACGGAEPTATVAPSQFEAAIGWPELATVEAELPEGGKPGVWCGSCLFLVVASPEGDIGAMGVRVKLDPKAVNFPVASAKLKIKSADGGTQQNLKINPKLMPVGKTALLRSNAQDLKFTDTASLKGALVEIEVKGKNKGERYKIRMPMSVK